LGINKSNLLNLNCQIDVISQTSSHDVHPLIKNNNATFISMKPLLFISFFLFLHPFLFGQETLVQSNSNDYGYSQTYVMYENGQFDYSSECNCTGQNICGSGNFTIGKKKISFQFDSTLSVMQSFDCYITIIKGTHKLKKKKNQFIRLESYYIEEKKSNKLWKRKKIKSKYTYQLKSNFNQENG